MTIPKLHYICQGNSPKALLENIQKACTSGIELVQLELQLNSNKQKLKIAQEAREITGHFQTRLLIANDYKLAIAIKADGVHIADGTSPTILRKELYSWQMLGGTANNIQDCERLIDKEIDYIRLGPFRSKESDISRIPGIGLNGYTVIAEALNTKTPLFGVGGIVTADVDAILETGISGIAVSEAITQNFESIRTFHRLLNASATAEQRHTFE
jgi:thiamine-phosphate pyrophosphorylase